MAITFVLVCFIVLFFFYLWDGGWIFATLFSLLIGAGATILFALILFGISPKEQHYYTVDIFSAASNSNINGGFVFGTGTINNVDRYSTFIAADGGKKKYTFESTGVVIKELNNVHPHVKIAEFVFTDNKWNRFWGLAGGKTLTEQSCVEMVVPEGSVTASFNIN